MKLEEHRIRLNVNKNKGIVDRSLVSNASEINQQTTQLLITVDHALRTKPEPIETSDVERQRDEGELAGGRGVNRHQANPEQLRQQDEF